MPVDETTPAPADGVTPTPSDEATPTAADEDTSTSAAAARRLRVLLSLGASIIGALVLVVIVVVISGGEPESGTPAPDSTQVAGVADNERLLDGVRQRGLTIGDKDAPLTVIEFIDVQCRFCRLHHAEEQPKIVTELVRTGRIKLRLAPQVVPGFTEDSEAGRAIALRLAREGKAWDFIGLFFANQGRENTGYATDTYLRKIVAAIPETTPAQAKRAADPRDAKTIAELRELANALRIEATPAFAIGRSGKDPKTYQVLDVTADPAADQIIAAVAKLERQF